MIREDNSVTNKTYVYIYDNNGNILSESIYAYTTATNLAGVTPLEVNTYGYSNNSWKDQLTSYNGVNITYDSVGNPLSYYNGMTFTWENINNLASITQGSNSYSYTYNDSGIRTSKTVNGVTHIYHLDGTRILSEEYGNVLIIYIYDEADSIIGMAYRESTYDSGIFDYYIFTKNLLGDILSIYNTNGSCVASYTYNAWGEHTVTNYTSDNIGSINPFRYRGYYFDTETSLYYLNARYYDPQIKRFINADTLDNLGASGDLNSFNLYAYCNNNPVMFVDPMGDTPMYNLFVGYKRATYVRIMSKMNHTKDSMEHQPIDKQSSVNMYHYGVLNATKNSCEIIAIHNAKIALEMDSCFAETMLRASMMGGQWLSGLFGTKPGKIDDILQSYGIECTPVALENITEPGVYIVSYFNKGRIFEGIHTITFEYSIEGGFDYYNKQKVDSNTKPTRFAYRYIFCYKLTRR